MFVEVCLTLLALGAFYYFRFRQKTQYCQELGIPTPKTVSFPFGNNPITSFSFMAGRRNPVRAEIF